MHRRTGVLAVATALVLTLIGAGPAQAELDDPVVSGLDSSTPGHVTGTVTSVAPYVAVRLSTDVAPEVVTLVAGSGTFDLETWGYAGTLPVYVASCDVAVPAAPEDCSTEMPSAATFTPTDVVPTPTWPTDTTVGPGDTPTVTVADPSGGGDLRAIWVNPGTDLETAVPRDTATPLALSDGTGLVRLVRCRTGSTSVCTAFTPDQKVDLVVHTVLAASVDPIADLTAASPTAAVTVEVDALGTYTLDWSLEQGGDPVPGQSGTASGTLDGNGRTEAFTLDGTDLFDGQYDVVVSITVTDPDFGAFPATEATGTVTVDGSGPSVTATVGPVQRITQSNPTATVTVDTDVAGTYALDWRLELDGTPVDGRSGSTTGTLDADGAASFLLDGTGLADGTYDVVTSITVTTAALEEYPPAEAVGSVVVDNTGPAVGLSASVETLYPLIALKAFPTLTRIDVTGDAGSVTGFVVRAPNGNVARSNLVLNVSKTVWDGRNDLGKVVPAGDYTISALDSDGNESASTVVVTVSRQTLVLKKFVRDVTASGTRYDQYVGRCSILKSHSSRYTPGSLGFYSNARCGTQTFAASAVSTAHAFQIPDLVKPLDWHVNVVGGSSRGYPGSRGILRYLTLKGNWAYEKPMSSGYGIHRGPTTSLTKFLDSNNFLVWGFVTAYGNAYDVTRFTVVVRYYALS